MFIIKMTPSGVVQSLQGQTVEKTEQGLKGVLKAEQDL